MKKLRWEMKIFITELKRPDSSAYETLLRKKAICINTNIDKVTIFWVLHDKVVLLTRRQLERGTRNRHQRIFRKVLTMSDIYIYRKYWLKDEFYMTLMELRLDFLEYIWRSLHSCFYLWTWLRGDLKSSVLWNWKSCNHNPNIKPNIFQI